MAVSWAMDRGAAGKRSRGWHGADRVASVYGSMECGRLDNLLSFGVGGPPGGPGT